MQTMCWLNDRIIDWANSGKQYLLNGEEEQLGSYAFRFGFDKAVTCENGIYSAIYQNLGTKGLLLKNGHALREINRTYYQADAYEYPITFATAKNGKTYLIHCPNEYCQLDFEDVETGEIVTSHPGRKAEDFFHSRLEVSPDNRYLLSKGWGWHPFDYIEVFDIEACMENPLLLDKRNFTPDADAEICAASFINEHQILLGAAKNADSFYNEEPGQMKPGQIAVWDLETDLISKPIDAEIGGHLTAIDDNFAWDLFEYPKIINYRTGEVVEKLEDINSGKQTSSIMGYLELPQIAINRKTKQVAIANGDVVEILSA